MEDESNPEIHIRLRLLSALVGNSTSAHRTYFENLIKKYLSQNLTAECLFILRRILLMTKTQDKNLCQTLWNEMRKLINEEDCSVLKLCGEYTNFSVDISNYRHFEFEKRLLEAIGRDEKYIELIPSKLAHTSMFVLPYSKNEVQIKRYLNKICDSWEQMTCMDWFKVTKGIQLMRQVGNDKYVTENDLLKLKRIFALYVSNKLSDLDLKEVNLLLRSCVCMDILESYVTGYLLMNFETHNQFSSWLIRTAVHTLLGTSSFSPVLMSKIVEYVENNGIHLLGSTVHKVLTLCYYLGYNLEASDRFFEHCIDVLIR